MVQKETQADSPRSAMRARRSEAMTRLCLYHVNPASVAAPSLRHVSSALSYSPPCPNHPFDAHSERFAPTPSGPFSHRQALSALNEPLLFARRKTTGHDPRWDDALPRPSRSAASRRLLRMAANTKAPGQNGQHSAKRHITKAQSDQGMIEQVGSFVFHALI